MRPTTFPTIWRATVIGVASLGLSTVGVATPAAATLVQTAVDAQGPDDEPGQKDLNAVAVEYRDGGMATVRVNVDDTIAPGANTIDVCALVDTDRDGLADHSLCHTWDDADGQATSAYVCLEPDDRVDRCTGPELLSGTSSSTSSSVVAGTDPFADIGGHRSPDACDEEEACYDDDLVITMHIAPADFGASADLVNVCSYPSQRPNSDPSDCVLSIATVVPDDATGYLTIEKLAAGDAGDGAPPRFTFTSSLPSDDDRTTFEVIGSGEVARVAFRPTTDLTVTEVGTDGWTLASAACTLETDQPTATGAEVPDGVSGVEIRAGVTTRCTFVNEPTPPPTADLSITKSVTPDTVEPGGVVSYAISVTNDGPDAAEAVVVTDVLPVTLGAAVVWSDDLGCAGDGTTITCTTAELDAGESADVVVEATVSEDARAGAIANIATVSADTIDPDPTDDRASAELRVVPPPPPPTADLMITKIGSAGPIAPGSAISYTLTISNLGPHHAAGVVVTDELPPGIVATSVESADFACDIGGSTITCTAERVMLGTLPQIVVAAAVTEDVTGTVVGAAAVAAATDDPDPSNNRDAAELTIVAAAPPTATTSPTATTAPTTIAPTTAPPTTAPTPTVASMSPTSSTTSTTTVAAALPATGLDTPTTVALFAALGLLVLGCGALVATRRR